MRSPKSPSRRSRIAAVAAAGFMALAGCASVAPLPSPVPVTTAATPTAPARPEPLPSLGSPEEGFTVVLEALRAGEWDAADRYGRAVGQTAPGTVWSRRSLFLRGQALAAAGRTDEASAALLAVPSEYPELADYALLMLADHLALKQRFVEAVGVYQRVLAEHPASVLAPAAALRKAQALHAAGSLVEAAAAYEQVLRTYPRAEQAPEAGLGLARARADAGDLVAAVRAALDLTVRHAGSPQDDEAETLLLALKARGATVPALAGDELAERGRVLSRLGQHERAHDAFKRALEADPLHPQRAELLLRSGIALHHLGRRPESASVLERLLRERLPDCRCSEALYWLGKSYSRLGMREEAVESFQRLVRSSPGSEWADDALYLAGNAHRDAGDMPKALAFYRRLADEYPDSPLADSGLWWEGWAHFTAGAYQKAMNTFQELARSYPRSFLANQALYWQGRAAERSGDRVKAQALYRRVTARGPYTYYGHLAAERLKGEPLPVVEAAEPVGTEGEAGEDAGSVGPEESDGPPDWTDEAIAALSENPAYHRTLELMFLGMKREAAAELASLRESMPRRSAALLGLSKTFFELGDYHSSLMIVLRNFERLLERPSARLTDDIWLLAYPQGYWTSIAANSRKYGLDPYFVAAIIREESQFRPAALSPAGARGIMQVMPATGEWVARSAGITGFDRSRLFEPDVNIAVGTWYLAHLLKRFQGNLFLVSAAYNAGPEPVLSWAGRNPPAEDPASFVEAIPYQETRGYVKKVLRNYAEYRRLYGREAAVSLLPAMQGGNGRTAGATESAGEVLCRAQTGCR